MFFFCGNALIGRRRFRGGKKSFRFFFSRSFSSFCGYKLRALCFYWPMKRIGISMHGKIDKGIRINFILFIFSAYFDLFFI